MTIAISKQEQQARSSPRALVEPVDFDESKGQQCLWGRMRDALQRKQAAANSQLHWGLLGRHGKKDDSQKSKATQQEEKLCPTNRKLKPMSSFRTEKQGHCKVQTSTDIGPLRMTKKIKTENCQTEIFLTNQDYCPSIKSKNQLLTSELHRRDSLLHLLKKKNKLQSRLYELNEDLWRMKHEKAEQRRSPNYSVRGNNNRSRIDIFHSQKSSQKQSYVQMPSRSGYQNAYNPQSNSGPVEKSRKAVNFVTRVSKESFQRRLRQQKVRESIMVCRVGEISMSCSRHRCGKAVMLGKVRQYQS